MDILRVMRGTARVVSLALQQEGVPVDADGAMLVTVVNAAGVVLELSMPATRVAVGTYTFTLSPSDTIALDVLSVTWSASVGGTAYVSTSTVEIVGGFWFDVPAARARPELAPFTDTEIAVKRTAAESFLEEQTGVSWVPRYRQETHLLDACPRLLVFDRGDVTALRSVAVNGVAADLTGVRVSRDGILNFFGTTGVRLLAAATLGDQVEVDVVYEYGKAMASPRAAQIALVLARHYLLRGPLDDRRLGLPVEGGGVVSLLTPGVRGSVTGIPEVDQFLIDMGSERSVA